MQGQLREMSQADFARDRGVSRAAVSQWKSKDILRDDAFTEPGKKGRVIYQVAVEQVRRNRDIGQSLGNGIATKTALDAVAGSDLPSPARAAVAGAPLAQPQSRPAGHGDGRQAVMLPKVETVEDQIKQAKLEQSLRQNRIQAAEEALKQGALMSADDARVQMARTAGLMLQVFEGALPDFAAVLAERFSIQQRDVLHLLRAEFRKVRTTAAAKEQARMAQVDQNADVTIDEV